MRKVFRSIFYIVSVLLTATLVFLKINESKVYFDTIVAGLVMLAGLHITSAFLFRTTMYGAGYVSTADGSNRWSRLVMFFIGIAITGVAVHYLT